VVHHDAREVNLADPPSARSGRGGDERANGGLAPDRDEPITIRSAPQSRFGGRGKLESTKTPAVRGHTGRFGADGSLMATATRLASPLVPPSSLSSSSSLSSLVGRAPRYLAHRPHLRLTPPLLQFRDPSTCRTTSSDLPSPRIAHCLAIPLTMLQGGAGPAPVPARSTIASPS